MLDIGNIKKEELEALGLKTLKKPIKVHIKGVENFFINFYANFSNEEIIHHLLKKGHKRENIML